MRKELIDNFVVRLDIFNDIFTDIKSSKMQHPEQHYIIQGVRGQGKTTLLLRIAYEIENDKELNKRLINVVFSEEQYSINKLYKLWESTAEYLKNYTGFEDLYDRMRDFEFNDDYEDRCFQLLEKYCKQNKKKLVLFIDNIDEMFGKLTRKEHHRLREVLIESAEFKIIGASSVSLEFHYDYGKPFYEFFMMPQLKGLSLEETKILILYLGEYYKKERIKAIVKNQPGRIEALRRITGGVIRTIILLYGIFADKEEGNAFQDLEKILDEVTTLYKHRMEKLSAQQQEIVDFIALIWDAVSTKEIAQKTRIKSKAVSSQLKFLQKNHIIEKQETKTKNNLYRLSERFFNIWYLMRHGGKREESKVRWLVEFLQIWCDEKELENRTKKQLGAIQKGKIYDKQALYMTEALARTPIKRELQDKLIKQTRNYLQSQHSELLSDLSYSDKELKIRALEIFKEKKDIKSAIKYIEQIKIKDKYDFKVLGQAYLLDFKNPERGKEYLLKAVEEGDSEAMNNLALGALAKFYETVKEDYNKAEEYYLKAFDKNVEPALSDLIALYILKLKEFKKTEKYLLIAIEKGDIKAILIIAKLYEEKFKNFKKAEKYYLKAVEKGDSGAMYNLALLYETEFKDIKKAEEYYLKAVEKDNSGAMYNLALLYKTEFKDIKKAEMYYLKAVEKGDSGAMYNLALLYETEFKDIKKAEEYYLMAVEKDNSGAMNNLAYLYQTEFKDLQKAEEYYLMAIEKGNNLALGALAKFYETVKEDYNKAEEYYLKAFDKNVEPALSDLIALYILKLKEFKKAEKYLLIAIEKGNNLALGALAKFYETVKEDYNKAEEYYLKAVEKDNSGAMYNLALLYETEFKDIKKAEEYYLMAVEKDNSGAMNSLAWMYYENRSDKIKALKYAKKGYTNEKNIYIAHTYAMILLWNDEIEKALEISKDFMESRKSYEKISSDIRDFLMLLIAKKQYHTTFKIFNENPFSLKDRYKPVYYALMNFLKDDYPNEYRKMGSELKETVEEIIKKIGQLEEDYE
ncbi:MAG: SEL1-like repeat protein [Candidatus Marinimicrobia bacterium]|nr:SEL1-like repeat protein [Candidatus Neomarinimicrobiota bacterium]